MSKNYGTNAPPPVAAGGAPDTCCPRAGGRCPEAIEYIRNLARTEPRFAPLGGAHERDGQIPFHNFEKGLADEDFVGLSDAAVKMVPEHLAPGSIRKGIGTFTGELYHGPLDYLRAIGRRPDALRQTRNLLVDKVGPVYEKWAARADTEGSVEGVRRRLTEVVERIDALEVVS